MNYNTSSQNRAVTVKDYKAVDVNRDTIKKGSYIGGITDLGYVFSKEDALDNLHVAQYKPTARLFKELGLIDKKGEPTELAKAFHGKDGKRSQFAAEIIRSRLMNGNGLCRWFASNMESGNTPSYLAYELMMKGCQMLRRKKLLRDFKNFVTPT